MGENQEYRVPWTSLAGQWLGLRASTLVGTGSIPAQGTELPHAAQRSQKKKSAGFLRAVSLPT